MKKNKLIVFIWIVAIVLGFVNIILYKGAMGELLPFEFKPYEQLLKFQYKAELYYSCGAIDLLLFCILVMYHRKKEAISPMLFGLLCFTVQIFMLMWKIKL